MRIYVATPRLRGLLAISLAVAAAGSMVIVNTVVLVKAGFVKSKSEARQAIQQGGVTLDGEKITDPRTTFAPADLGEGKMLRKGKKNFVKVIAE